MFLINIPTRLGKGKKSSIRRPLGCMTVVCRLTTRVDCQNSRRITIK